MFRRIALLLSLLALPCAAAYAEDPKLADDEAADFTDAEQIKLAQKIAPGFVRVQYTLQTDQGEEPGATLATVSRLGSGDASPISGVSDPASLLRDERPLESAGILIGPKRVLTADVTLHPRFIRSIRVRFGEKTVDAKPVGYARDHTGTILELAEELPGAKPLEFDPKSEPPYFAAHYIEDDAQWTVTLEPFARALALVPGGRQFASLAAESLIVDTRGKAVAVSMTGQQPIDDSWKVSPADWPLVTTADHQKLLESATKTADASLLRVELNFRSPRQKAGGGEGLGRTHAGNGEDETATEVYAVGLLLDDSRVLVLADLAAHVTARLERVNVATADGLDHPATFVATLADYGALVVKLEKPLPGAAKLSTADVLAFRNTLLPGAEVRMAGPERIAYYDHTRITSYTRGWKQQLYPHTVSDTGSNFVFTPAGELLALPIARRQKVSVRQQGNTETALLTPMAQLAPVLAAVEKHADPANVPLTDEQEGRVAWMGVVLQPLDKELARANKVADVTHDGQIGALVTFVYPGSPAADAGIEAGAILLRLQVADQPKPIDVQVEADTGFPGGFPWDKLDQIPDEYFDRLPTPWPPLESAFTDTLTELGMGTKYEAEFIVDGKRVSKPFAVVQSPQHYDTAAKYKNKAMGLGVRDLTFEVRRYLQVEAADPGVIVGKIEPGEKAAVAGLRPFELITHVNDQPVHNVKEFEALVSKGTEFRFAIKRMNRGRQISIKLDAADEGAKPEPKEGDSVPRKKAKPADDTDTK
jgi:serine protease Do